MSKQLTCDLDGCHEEITAETAAEVLALAADHAKKVHAIEKVSDELVTALTAKIEDR